MTFWALVRRDLGHMIRSGTILLPIIFFMLVATLYPFAVGPDSVLLARTGGGVLWVAALLAALLPIDRLIAPDVEAGVIDQLGLRGVSEETVAVAKMTAHWLGFAPGLLIAALPAAALLRLDARTLQIVEIGLALATPGLAALAVMTASFTVSLRSASALTGLLMLPLAIPLLIFGAGSLGSPSGSGLKLLAASSLLLLAIAPFATGAALRALRT
jgi:heme exporter protein B